MERKARPLGIVVLGAWIVLFGAFSLVSAVLLLVGKLSDAVNGSILFGAYRWMADRLGWDAVLALLGGAIAEMVIGIGLFKLRRWARFLTLLAALFTLPLGISDLVRATWFHSPAMYLFGGLFLAFGVVAPIYLTRKRVKQAFLS